jgi:hypothetical protein
MTDPPAPPRVRVRLPGGRTVTGRLLAWRQDADGVWQPEVALTVPAAAVAPVDGEDYAGVPRIAADPPAGPGFAVATARLAGADGKQRLILHVADCWAIPTPGPAVLVTPVPDARQAAAMLKFADTSACDVCNPAP